MGTAPSLKQPSIQMGRRRHDPKQMANCSGSGQHWSKSGRHGDDAAVCLPLFSILDAHSPDLAGSRHMRPAAGLQIDRRPALADTNQAQPPGAARGLATR
jgi:hypothetical protein